MRIQRAAPSEILESHPHIFPAWFRKFGNIFDWDPAAARVLLEQAIKTPLPSYEWGHMELMTKYGAVHTALNNLHDGDLRVSVTVARVLQRLEDQMLRRQENEPYVTDWEALRADCLMPVPVAAWAACWQDDAAALQSCLAAYSSVDEIALTVLSCLSREIARQEWVRSVAETAKKMTRIEE